MKLNDKIVLDYVAPNGKLIAYGEVVVIEDNFGLRITHITDPAKRLSSLGANANQEASLTN